MTHKHSVQSPFPRLSLSLVQSPSLPSAATSLSLSLSHSLQDPSLMAESARCHALCVAPAPRRVDLWEEKTDLRDGSLKIPDSEIPQKSPVYQKQYDKCDEQRVGWGRGGAGGCVVSVTTLMTVPRTTLFAGKRLL